MGHTISTFQYNIAIQLRCFCELITTIMLNMVYNIFFSLSSLPLKYVLQYAQYQYLIWWGIVLSARTRSEDVNYEIMMTRSSFMMFRKARQRQNRLDLKDRVTTLLFTHNKSECLVQRRREYHSYLLWQFSCQFTRDTQLRIPTRRYTATWIYHGNKLYSHS